MSRALEDWAYQRGVQLDFIWPGNPVGNTFIGSFSGRLRDECLNVHPFTSLEDAKAKTEAWRVDYNQRRPHSSRGHLTPEHAPITAAKNPHPCGWPATAATLKHVTTLGPPEVHARRDPCMKWHRARCTTLRSPLDVPSGVLDTTFSTPAPGEDFVRVRAGNAFGQSPPSNALVVVVL